MYMTRNRTRGNSSERKICARYVKRRDDGRRNSGNGEGFRFRNNAALPQGLASAISGTSDRNKYQQIENTKYEIKK